MDMSWDSHSNNDIKKDFVTYLPYDEIATIFSLCSFRDCIRFTRVSVSWRTFLLCWPGLWENITDRHCNYVDLLTTVPSTIQGRHVHKVDVQNKNMNEQQAVIEFLQKMNCNALDSLRISSNSNNIEILKQVLQTSGPSLKRVDIKMKGDPRYIRLLAVILKHCQTQLTHLRYQHSNPIRPLNLPLDGRILPRQPLQNLISLDIGCLMEMSYFQRLIELLPRLKSICVNSAMIINMKSSGQLLDFLLATNSSPPFLPECQNVGIYGEFGNGSRDESNDFWELQNDNDLAPLFQRFMSTATQGDYDGTGDDIEYNAIDRIQMNDTYDDNEQEQHHNNSKLRRLVLQKLQEGVNRDTVASILRTHHSTLEAICVTLCRETTTLLFPPLEFLKLREIQIHDNNVELSVNINSTENLVRMLHMSPCLEDVYLNCRMPMDYVIRGLQGGSYRLRTLCLRDATNSGSVGTLSRILSTGWPQLRCLSLYGVNDVQGAEQLLRLKNIIADCPNLEIVDLDCVLAAGEGVLSTIGNLEYLRSLRVQRDMGRVTENRASMISAESMISFLRGNCRRSLRKLCILDVTTFNDAVLDAMMENMADNLVYLQLAYPRNSMFLLRHQLRQQNNNNNHNRGVSTSSSVITPEGIRRWGRGFVGKPLKYIGFYGITLSVSSSQEAKDLQIACNDVQRLFPPEQQIVVDWTTRGNELMSDVFGSIPLNQFSTRFQQI